MQHISLHDFKDILFGNNLS